MALLHVQRISCSSLPYPSLIAGVADGASGTSGTGVLGACTPPRVKKVRVNQPPGGGSIPNLVCDGHQMPAASTFEL